MPGPEKPHGRPAPADVLSEADAPPANSAKPPAGSSTVHPSPATPQPPPAAQQSTLAVPPSTGGETPPVAKEATEAKGKDADTVVAVAPAPTGKTARVPGGPTPTVDFRPPATSQAETLGPPATAGSSVPAATPEGPPLECNFADYELLEELARGGMGVVFKARQKHPRRIVALKMILAGQLASPDQVRRFLIEAEEAGQLDHPNIVPIYNVGEHNGQHFFTMKLIEGGTLARQMGQLARKEPIRAARLMASISRAVHYAHQHGVLHRDLKPGNILLDADGQPHVTDFGLAKHLGSEGANTQSGAIIGTPSYMAPEQAKGKKDLSVAADVYGLGAILYEMLTGQPPFRGDTPVETILAVIEDEPPAPRSLYPRLDRDLETICLKCLSKHPTRRYASAAEVAEDLDRYLANEPIQARPTSRMQRLVKWAKRRPALATLVAVSAVALLVLLGGSWVYATQLQAALRAEEKQREQAQANAEEANRQREQAQANAKEANRQREQAQANAKEANRQREQAQVHAKEANRQREQAQVNAKEANRQREQVKKSFEKRLDMVDDMVRKIDGRLAQMEGMDSVRVEFLHEMLNLNLDLLKEKPNDLLVRRQTGKVYASLGDLEMGGGQFQRGGEAYQKALDLLTRLAQETGDHADRSEVAQVHARRATLLRQWRRHADAKVGFEKVIALNDQLAKDFPDKAGLSQLWAARALFQIGDCQEELRRPREAEQAYRQALQRQQDLAERYPKGMNTRRDLARTAFSLRSLLEKRAPAEQRRILEQGHRAWREAYQLAPQMRDNVRGYTASFFDLVACYKKQGLHAELLKLGRAQSVAGLDEANDHYNAACILSEAAGVVEKQAALPEAQRQRLAEGYGSEAVKFLNKSLQCGFKDRTLFDSDPDLQPLRKRADFLKVMADLDKRLPAQAKTPAHELQRIVAEHAANVQNIQGQLAQAQSVAERRRALRKRPQLEPVARNLLDLARKHPNVDAAVDALGWIVSQTGPEGGKQPAAHRKLHDEALQLLERDHFNKPGMTAVCQLLARTSSPAGDRLLDTLTKKHPDRTVRGLASYAQPLSLEQQWLSARVRNPALAAKLSPQTEQQFQHVVKEFGDVPIGRSTLGSTAKADRHRFLYLNVGRTAQEIEGEDVAGKTFKLSEHRGKVVLLSFWAHWCGYCRQLYPHEKALVRRYQGQPFVLLGINCEDNRAEAARAQQRVGMTWRSWWATAGKNGPIQNEWQVDGFPTLYLLDHKGVIRSTNLRGAALEAAIDRLVAEAQAESVRPKKK